MAWDSAIKAALLSADRAALDVAIRISTNATGAGIGGDFLIASDPRLDPGMILDSTSLQLQGASLTVPDFRYQAGGFSVEFNLPDRLGITRGSSTAPFAALRRGALCELLIGFGSGNISDYIRFKLGVINNVEILSTKRARAEIYDIVYGLRARPTPALTSGNEPQTRLFDGLAGNSTTIASGGYAAGASTINLTSSAGFETFNGTGVVKITGDSGSTFYAKFTGVNTGANQLTGVTSGQFGSTDEAAAAGNAAVSTAYLNGHPARVIWRMLVSTGTASANGSQDVYPESAGFGLDEKWIETDSIRALETEIAPSSGSYSMDVIVEEPAEDGLHYLGALLAEFGIWIVQSEGQIGLRAAFPVAAPNIEKEPAITDLDCINFPGSSLYDPSVPYAYQKLTVQSATTGSQSVQAGQVLPLRDELIYDVSQFIRNNEAPIRVEIRDRLDDFAFYIPVRVRVTIRGTWHGYAPGDFIRFSSAHTRGRFKSTLDGYDNRSAFVVSVMEDLIGGFTDLDLLIYPLSRSDDYA